MLTTQFFATALFCLFAIPDLASAKFKVVREWNYVNFTWPSASLYREALDQQMYIPENNIIAGLKYFEGFYYISLPRMKTGVPATLTRIPAGATRDTAPLLMPFPSWEMNKLDDCDALQNVQNTEIDPVKGQIWIIDGGRTDTLGNSPVTTCKPKLVVYDIRKEQKVFTYTFAENVASFNGSFLYDIVLDDYDQGYAYISDNSGRDPGIIVYSLKDREAWKIRHSQSMRADPNASSFRVNGVTISASLNIASLALGPGITKNGDQVVLTEDRELFYAPLSSLHLYSISTNVLRNKAFSIDDSEYQGNVKDYGLKGSQTVGMIMDNKGVLYYSLLSMNSVAKWNSNTPFQTGQKIIARDERYLEWVNSFSLDDSGNLTLLVNKLNRFIYGKLDLNEANFRLIASNVGGKSYLYDRNYNYEAANISNPSTSPASITTTTTEKMDERPMFKVGMDQDPYLAPNPSREPVPTPEPEPDSTSHSSSTSIASSSPSTSQPSTSKAEEPSSARSISKTAVESSKPSSSNRNALGLLTLMTAGMLFVV